jgi:hypothetical protein
MNTQDFLIIMAVFAVLFVVAEVVISIKPWKDNHPVIGTGEKGDKNL